MVLHVVLYTILVVSFVFKLSDIPHTELYSKAEPLFLFNSFHNRYTLFPSTSFIEEERHSPYSLHFFNYYFCCQEIAFQFPQTTMSPSSQHILCPKKTSSVLRAQPVLSKRRHERLSFNVEGQLALFAHGNLRNIHDASDSDGEESSNESEWSFVERRARKLCGAAEFRRIIRRCAENGRRMAKLEKIIEELTCILSDGVIKTSMSHVKN